MTSPFTRRALLIGALIRKRVRYSLELGFGDRFRIGYRG